MSKLQNASSSKLLVTVLYRTDIQDSVTLQSMVKAGSCLTSADRLFIWDNSPEAQLPEQIQIYRQKIKPELIYRHTPENTSLARVYNSIIRENDDCGFVFLYDQDSSFDAAYFEEINDAVIHHPEINLFVPLIWNENVVASPGHFFYFKGKYWKAPRYGIISAANTVAITSGMCIRMSYLKSFGGFEEALQLYGVDSNFMIRYARDNASLFVIKAPFIHHLSDFTSEPREVKRRRFEDFKKSALINAKLFSLPVRWLTHIFLWYRSIRF